MSPYGITRPHWVNTLRSRQHGCHFADDTFKRTFLNENVRIPIKNSLKFVHKGPINNIPALAQIMAWQQSGDKPLSEPTVAKLPTHICITRPQWVNSQKTSYISPSQAKDKVEYSLLSHSQFSPKYSQETPPWLSSKGKICGVMLYFVYHSSWWVHLAITSRLFSLALGLFHWHSLLITRALIQYKYVILPV